MTHDIEICNENDQSDPDYGPPELWGLWADRDVYELGPGLPLTDDFDLAELRQFERDPAESFEPSDEDLDALERLETERAYGVNARFV